MRRQIINDRQINFTEEEQYDILNKTNWQCAHCGKKIAFHGQGATIDHFIPLKKGGVNRKYNLIPLCYDCNQNKHSLIVAPENYIHYMNKDAYNELMGYWESYINSFEYISMENLLCCDEYIIEIIPPTVAFSSKNQKTLNACKIQYTLSRTYPAAKDECKDFYIKSLRKYTSDWNEQIDDEKQRRVFDFFYEFGAIYAVRSKNNEIKILIVTQSPLTNPLQNKKPAPFISMQLYSCYDNELNRTLIASTPKFIAQTIAHEQHFPEIYYDAQMLQSDPAHIAFWAASKSVGTYKGDMYDHILQCYVNPDFDFETHPDYDFTKTIFYKVLHAHPDALLKHIDDFFTNNGTDIIEIADLIVDDYIYGTTNT